MIVKAVKVIEAISSGSSHPIVVEGEDGRRYFVKLTAGMSGDLAAISEWICCHVAGAMELPALAPRLITVDHTLEIAGFHIEVRELIGKSGGLNLAFPYLGEIKPFHETDADALEQALLRRLFLFDLLLINLDRNGWNTNLLRHGGRLYSFDYESSFLLKGILEQKEFWDDSRVHQQLRHNPMFREGIGAGELAMEIKRLGSVPMEEIAAGIPDSWISGRFGNPDDLRNRIVRGFRQVLAQPAPFYYLLDRIRQSPVESPEARKARMLANRRSFERGLDTGKSY